MEGLIKKKLNALAHIAKIDGHFADSEKDVLYDIARKYGKEDHELLAIIENPEPVGEFHELTEYHKLEFMYVAIKIMRADGLIYDSEVEFCKNLARKMGFNPDIVDEYSTVEDLNFELFQVEGKAYLL
ncbi:MAG: TerB family tellurite resistance protein [Cyclobacteriaceae bacterium]|nr:TerB family tellurite resistance protein [Cyclobacteriaceae bacterium]